MKSKLCKFTAMCRHTPSHSNEHLNALKSVATNAFPQNRKPLSETLNEMWLIT